MYNHAMTSIRVRSQHREEIIDITAQVQKAVAKSGHRSGLVAVYCPHTTAAISVNENADPDVKSDMVKFLGKLIPVSKEFRHAEGNEDAHIKAVLAGFSQVLLVEEGALLLGEWQEVWFMEFDGPREREVWVKVIPG
jgi:secondary thiamine-phosphate synthase enzyme